MRDPTVSFVEMSMVRCEKHVIPYKQTLTGHFVFGQKTEKTNREKVFLPVKNIAFFRVIKRWRSGNFVTLSVLRLPFKKMTVDFRLRYDHGFASFQFSYQFQYFSRVYYLEISIPTLLLSGQNHPRKNQAGHQNEQN